MADYHGMLTGAQIDALKPAVDELKLWRNHPFFNKEEVEAFRSNVPDGNLLKSKSFTEAYNGDYLVNWMNDLVAWADEHTDITNGWFPYTDSSMCRIEIQLSVSDTIAMYVFNQENNSFMKFMLHVNEGVFDDCTYLTTLNFGHINESIDGIYRTIGSIINHGTRDTSGYTLTKNNVHVWGEVASLDVSSLEDADGEYMIEFRSGATATTLTYGQSLKWNETASVEANKTYKMWIVRGCATLMGFE